MSIKLVNVTAMRRELLVNSDGLMLLLKKRTADGIVPISAREYACIKLPSAVTRSILSLYKTEGKLTDEALSKYLNDALKSIGEGIFKEVLELTQVLSPCNSDDLDIILLELHSTWGTQPLARMDLDCGSMLCPICHTNALQGGGGVYYGPATINNVTVTDTFHRECLHSIGYIECPKCHKLVSPESMHTTCEGHTWCSSCLSSMAVCEAHGTPTEDSRTYTDTQGMTHSYCSRAFDERFISCSRCGQVVPIDQAIRIDGRNYCSNCAEQVRYSTAIGGHTQAPGDYVFYRRENEAKSSRLMYYGVELEIDRGGCNSKKAYEILQRFSPDKKLMFIKRDGSLRDGLEIVSHPCTFDYHLKEYPWPDLMKMCRDMGYDAYDVNTCGLHIHTSRTGWGATGTERELNYAKILAFIVNNWEQVKTFSRRNKFDYCRKIEWSWSAGDAKALYKRHAERGDRYTVMNVLPSQTIEFRVFRGTLNPMVLGASMGLLNAMFETMFPMSLHDVMQFKFEDLMNATKGMDDYAAMHEYWNTLNTARQF